MSNTNQPQKRRGESIRRLVDRTIQRSVNGVGYIVSPHPVVGKTPKELVSRRGPMSLLHYKPQTEEIYRTPLLLVSPTTNRGYCLDMMPGASFAEFFVRAGFDVFHIDWDAPRPEDHILTLQDYSQTFIRECIEQVQLSTGEQDVTLVGYCMGGVLAAIYAASYGCEFVRNLVCMTTPVDYTKMGMFSKITDKKHFDVDRLVDSIGNIPPSFVLAGFESLEPAGKAASRVRLWEKMWDSDFVEVFRKYDRWANDMLPFAGEFFREMTKELSWKNGLLEETLIVGDRPVKLSNIDVPFIHAVAKHDNIVPRAASAPLIDRVGSADKTEIELKGGHVSLVAGANAVGRLWPTLDEWLSERST